MPRVNRYELCQRHKLPFKTVALDFADEEAAMDWIVELHLGRRHFKPDAESY